MDRGEANQNLLQDKQREGTATESENRPTNRRRKKLKLSVNEGGTRGRQGEAGNIQRPLLLD